MPFHDYFATNPVHSNDVLSYFGRSAFDVGEVIITGRVPGALYADDLAGGDSFLNHILPLFYDHENAVGGQDPDHTVTITALEGGSDFNVQGPDSTPANAPAPLAPDHLKGDEPLVLVTGSAGHDASVSIALSVTDYDALSGTHDLPVFHLASAAVAQAYVTVDATPHESSPTLVIGGRSYESLSFLIIDTPFAYGDDHLPANLRPTINELLGFNSTDEEDAWVIPSRAWLLT